MDKDAERKLMERVRRARRSEVFKDYRVELVPMMHQPMCDMIYDMPLRTIWINTTAQPGANICELRQER